MDVSVGAGCWALVTPQPGPSVDQQQCRGLWQSPQHLTHPQAPPQVPVLSSSQFRISPRPTAVYASVSSTAHRDSSASSPPSGTPRSLVALQAKSFALLLLLTVWVSYTDFKVLNKKISTVTFTTFWKDNSLYMDMLPRLFSRNTEKMKTKDCPPNNTYLCAPAAGKEQTAGAHTHTRWGGGR